MLPVAVQIVREIRSGRHVAFGGGSNPVILHFARVSAEEEEVDRSRDLPDLIEGNKHLLLPAKQIPLPNKLEKVYCRPVQRNLPSSLPRRLPPRR
jgi:hypothetical protein